MKIARSLRLCYSSPYTSFTTLQTYQQHLSDTRNAMATNENNDVVIINVVQGPDGKSTITYVPVPMSTTGWIGNRSEKCDESIP